MTTRRAERVSSLIRQEICELLLEQVNDPRLKNFISVTEVSTSPDLKNAKIFVSVLGDEQNAKDVLQGFKSASGYLRRELSRRLLLRYAPELSFELDTSIERGVRITNLIQQVSEEDSDHESGRDSKRK